MSFLTSFEKYSFPNFGWTRLPKPPITKEDRLKYGSNENESNVQFLYRLARAGFQKKLKSGQIPQEKRQEYIDRCKFELDTFNELHFSDYILLVWKTIEKARELGVFIDYGRGSVSSSVVSWFLDVSGCDPIRYKLFFSRFVNRARTESKIVNNEVWVNVSLIADIDVNLGDGRDEIIQWLKEIYPNRISKISNINTLTGKILIKDVYKTFENANEEQAKEVSDLIERRFGVVEDIEDAYKNNPEFKKWADAHFETYQICLKLRDLNRNTSSHASGYLVSYEELTEHTPLILDSDKEITSAYTMDDVQCLKLDLLSLNTNKIIKNTLDLITLDVDSLNLHDDSFIYNLFQNDNLLPYGLYQISAPCAYKVCMNLKPKNLMELSHVNAIARPAALVYEKPYLENSAPCPHPLFKDALEWTRYLFLYQEQCLLCLRAIGFTEEESEMARRVFAKKKHHEVEEQVEKVKQKLEENKFPKEAGDALIKLANEAANYQFSLAHSISTSMLTSLTVLLKYKYPLQFYIACLNEARNKANLSETIGEISKELPHFGIKLLPPHVVHSSLDFKEEGCNIRFALSAIKGVGSENIKKLRNFKTDFSNKFDIFQSSINAGLPSGVMSSIILTGCLDHESFNTSRAKILLEYQLYKLLTDKEKSLVLELGKQFDFKLISILKYLNKEKKNEKGKPVLKDSRLSTIKKHYQPFRDIYEHNIKYSGFCQYFFEFQLLGFSYSTNLHKIFNKHCGDLVTIQQAIQSLEDEYLHIAARVGEVKIGKSKKGTKYLKCDISDNTGSIKIMVFDTERNSNIENCIEENGRIPKEDDIIILRGRKKGDCIFIQSLSIQDIKVFQKISQLGKKSLSTAQEPVKS